MKSPLVTSFILRLSAFLIFSAVHVRAQVSSEYLNPHNAARQSVGAGIPDLVWSDTLTTYATNWANHQANQDSCNLVHSGGEYGKNIFWSSSGSSTPGDAVQAWVDEKQYYNYDTSSCASGEVCGHYTQVVWKTTLRVGYGSAACSSSGGGGTFVVCSYDPLGNFAGESPYILTDRHEMI